MAIGVRAQGPTGLTFEVASIKQNKSGDPRIGLDISRGQLRATNEPLQLLLRQAFEVMDSQTAGLSSTTPGSRVQFSSGCAFNPRAAARRPLQQPMARPTTDRTSSRRSRSRPASSSSRGVVRLTCS